VRANAPRNVVNCPWLGAIPGLMPRAGVNRKRLRSNADVDPDETARDHSHQGKPAYEPPSAESLFMSAPT
jgi:hypothetical protein